MKRIYAVAVILATGLVAVAGVAAFGGVGGAAATVAGGTDMQTTTIEGSHESGAPSEVIVSASGTYEWKNLYPDYTYVTINALNDDGDRYQIAKEMFLTPQDGRTEASFDNVSADILKATELAGWADSDFIAENDGETANTTVPIEVTVELCEEIRAETTCTNFTERHNVTVTVHNTESTGNDGDGGGGAEGPATVTGSTELDGYMTFEGN